MESASQLQIIQQAYADFAKGNIQGIVDVCTEDITWGAYDNPVVPYSRTYKGKAGVQEFFSTLNEYVNYTEFTPREFYSDRDAVIVLGHHTGTVRKNDKTFSHDWSMFFKFRGNIVYSYFAFIDTKDQTAAFL